MFLSVFLSFVKHSQTIFDFCFLHLFLTLSLINLVSINTQLQWKPLFPSSSAVLMSPNQKGIFSLFFLSFFGISAATDTVEFFNEFSLSVMSKSLPPHEPQHTRPPSPSPTPRAYSNSCPWSQWCHSAISSSVVPFSSCPQSLPASGSFPMSQLFALLCWQSNMLSRLVITFPPRSKHLLISWLQSPSAVILEPPK